MATVAGSDSPLPYGGLVVGVVLLAAAVIGLGVVLLLIRRWTRRANDESASGPSGGWTLQDMRALRDSGEITVQEYERLRAGLLGQAASPPPPKPRAAAPRPEPAADSDGFLSEFGDSDDNGD